jgi:hypothetical protein
MTMTSNGNQLPIALNPKRKISLRGLLAMISFAGSPELKEQLNSRCRDLISFWYMPAKVVPMVIKSIERRGRCLATSFVIEESTAIETTSCPNPLQVNGDSLWM